MPAHRLGLRRPRRTARLRFTAVYGCLFLVSGVVLVAVTYGLFQRATEYAKPHLPNVPHAPAIRQLTVPRLAPFLPQLAFDQQQLTQDQHKLLKLYPVGVSDAGPMSPFGPRPQVLTQLAQDQRRLTRDQHQLASTVSQLAQAVHQVSQAGSVQAAQRAADSHQLLVDSGIALAIVAVLALGVGWLVTGRMLRPIRTITATARRISASNLAERLGLDRADEEFRRLGDTLDDLFARLEASFEAQRHFVANASHELRTPLTAERNLLQVALDDPDTSAEAWRSTAGELLASNDEQKHLIDALLTLASSESGLDHRELTDLAGICETVLARPAFLRDRLDVDIDTAILPAGLVGDPRLLERLIANLVDNAVSHNLAGGSVHISTGTEDGKAILTVTNTGPVIPPGEIDRLFQPFQRLDPRRAHHKHGHGLGLSIVQAIATSHEATVTTYPQPEGGLSITVTFPAPTSSAPSRNRAPQTRRIAAGSV
ncbi:MAG TPA: HAMP domain-containing sensor histidine kinase [Solirubrobacteraceae bacterium]|nr:HAMP domain-containing sensor histidine kinase [Solirubrobacteraceae bacterium]